MNSFTTAFSQAAAAFELAHERGNIGVGPGQQLAGAPTSTLGQPIVLRGNFDHVAANATGHGWSWSGGRCHGGRSLSKFDAVGIIGMRVYYDSVVQVVVQP
jgi:hypothetical protein